MYLVVYEKEFLKGPLKGLKVHQSFFSPETVHPETIVYSDSILRRVSIEAVGNSATRKG